MSTRRSRRHWSPILAAAGWVAAAAGALTLLYVTQSMWDHDVSILWELPGLVLLALGALLIHLAARRQHRSWSRSTGVDPSA